MKTLVESLDFKVSLFEFETFFRSVYSSHLQTNSDYERVIISPHSQIQN